MSSAKAIATRRSPPMQQCRLVRLPGQAARAIRSGANPAPDRAIGRRAWEAFVAKRGTHPVASRVRRRHLAART